MGMHKLKVEKRTILGRKVKKLRHNNILPANIYGRKIASLAVQVERVAFERTYRAVGETGIVSLVVKGEKKPRPVLISNVQHHPVTDKPLHVDFHQVVLSEKIEATIPLRFVGEAPAVKEKVGALFKPMDEVEVKALPADLPESIEVDISTLRKLDQEIKVKDLSVDKKKIEILTDSEQIVAKIGPLVTKEAEEQAREEEAAAKEAKEEAKEEKLEEKPEVKVKEEVKEAAEEKEIKPSKGKELEERPSSVKAKEDKPGKKGNEK